MARKTDKYNVHEFTRQIHSTRRTGTIYANMPNHNEKLAKQKHDMVCRECRYFYGQCSDYIGQWHELCKDFQWD